MMADMTKSSPLILVALGFLGACGSSAGGGGDAGAGSDGAAAGASGGSSGAAGGAAGKGALPACPNAAPIPASQTACRTNADCQSTLWTCGPSYYAPGPGGCGPCMAPPHECTVDGDCGAGKICLPQPSQFCQCPGGATKCAPACTATSCTPNETCDTASGHCKPTPCGPAYTCGAGLICAPTRAGADANGCAIAKCATDGYACPDGYACGAGQNVDFNGCSEVSCVGAQFKCPGNTDCDAASPAPHHCKRRACTSDQPCDCGACIQGSCQDEFFVCSPPQNV
jgi:hypothetical protein